MCTARFTFKPKLIVASDKILTVTIKYAMFNYFRQNRTYWDSSKVIYGKRLTISTGDCTLQCGMWLWNRDSEFTKWQHPAMWYVALGWHAIKFAQTSAILEFYIWFPFPHITAVDMSFCTSLRNFIQIGPPSAENKKLSYRRETVRCLVLLSTLVSRWRLL